MPRYFFDIDDGLDLHDNEGTELSDVAEIEPVALRTLADIARDKAIAAERHPLTVIVRDETGNAVYRAMMSTHTQWFREPESWL